MASILQRVGALNQKACTFTFGASAAAHDNVGPARVPLGRPGVDFTRSFLVGGSGFSLAMAEQLQTGLASKLPTFAVRATGRDLLPPRPSNAQSSTGLEMKQCLECKRAKPLVDFERAGKGLKRSCRACVAVLRAGRSGKEMAHMAMSVEESWQRAKPCVRCGLVKELRDFCPDKKAGDGAQSRCRACKATYANDTDSIVQPKPQVQKTLESLSPLSDAAGVSRDYSESGNLSGEDELTLERQFEVTKNIWETLLAEPAEGQELPVLIPDATLAPSDPIFQQARSIDSDAASETIAALQVKLLRLDFDLSHARATKAVFSDQVQYLERVMSDSTEENEKMRLSLKEATSSIGDLESHVERLEEEGRNLRGRLLRLDFDLTHTRATRSILGDRVEDLERAIAEDKEESRVRDEKLSTALAEASASNATLRAQVEEAQSEASNLLSKVLNFSLDLDHAQFGKTMLSGKVQDLEKSLHTSEEAFQAREEGVKRALEESNVAIAELETLRENHKNLLSRSIRSDFDLEHHKYGKQVLGEKVADLEKTVNDIREEDETLKAALAKATASNTELEAQVTGLQEEAKKLKTNVLNFSFDLTHSGATRGILSERVKDLERMVSEQTEESRIRDEKLRESLAESTKAVAEVTRLESEGGELKSKLLRLDLDLAHARAHKEILGDKVDDLERLVNELRTDDETMRSSLAEAVSSNAALETEVTSLQLESTNLRNQVLYLSLDFTHAQAGKSILSERVADLEKELGDFETQEEKLKAADALTAKLEAEVERLSEEEGKLLSRNLSQDFDLAHLTALKGILENRVADIDNAVAARDEAEANMKAALAARDQAEAKVADLDEQRSKFQSQSLRKDFDVTHLKALKAILSDRVADLERVVAVHEDIGEKLKDANVDKAELAAEVERLTEEGRSLQSKLLRKDFDMTHTRALRAILHTKVEDLEKEIAEQNNLGEQLEETRADKAKLESDVQRLDAERTALQSQSIRKDFDLMHFQALKAILEDKVKDLERVADEHTDMGLKLKDATLTNAALEAELQRLETQEGALRSQMLSRDFDLTHTRALKDILHGRVQDLEKIIEEHNDMGEELTVTKSINAQLEAEMQALQTRGGEVLSENLGKDFDLTHYRALKAILEGRVEDLQKTIAAHEDLSEKLKASHLANAELEREVGRLGEEGTGLRSKLLLQDFDLTNTRALKNILNEKVQDLERVIADHDDMGAKLRASKSENIQLEGRVARLEETEGELKSKLLWKDLDLQHYHALKDILDDKVQGLEKAVANLDEAARLRDEKLRVALTEASASSAENTALKEETSSLKFRLFSTDLDLTHEKAGKAILADKVQDLERVLANYDELALARDASLAEALSSVDELEAEVARLEQERSLLQSKNIRMDFDLAHVKAIKSILGEKVVDLEREGEELTSALTEAISSKTELEGKVGQLSTGLKAVMQEERSLRGNQAELKRQLFNLQLDNQSLHRSTERRTQMLEEKQQKLAELEIALAKAQNEAETLSRQLESAVTQSGGELKAAEAKETVGDQLLQIASLTASVQKAQKETEGTLIQPPKTDADTDDLQTEGTRIQLVETDADTLASQRSVPKSVQLPEIDVDTDDEVVESDEDNDDEKKPTTGVSEEVGAAKGGVGTGLASAGLSVLLVLALGGYTLLHPTPALPHSDGSDSFAPVERAAVEQVVSQSGSKPHVVESGSNLHMAAPAVVSDSGSKPQMAESGSKPLMAESGFKPRMAESGSKPLIAEIVSKPQLAAPAVKTFTPAAPAVKAFTPAVNPIAKVAAAMLEPLEENPVEDFALLELTSATGPTEEQQAEELSLVSEMSSKLFEAAPGDEQPSNESVQTVFEPECKVDMC